MYEYENDELLGEYYSEIDLRLLIIATILLFVGLNFIII
jgi:hypothetical protein